MRMDEKIKNFELFIHRRHMARFIARYELFKRILDIEGSIIECGVWNGGGIFAWAKLSEIFEPYGIKRKVIGFDTFEGFPHINDKDKGTSINPNLKKGAFKSSASAYDSILKGIKDFNEERYLNHVSKIELIKGDAIQTIPNYLDGNKHLIISLLFLDFDVYEPTKIALNTFLPRMPRGSVLAFDEINNDGWPGETVALIEEMKGLSQVKIEKFHFDSNISFIVL
ncbi:MAG: dTDP-6-deoxy-L-hexose 3-O-methyltransferase [Nitrospiraceae bacterium]|nr:dTDP-6-deoxy-L-hexose 3-O-methyltransferase [Nitrospiraceae bacterium]|tara:strand:- start:2527 stop:3201 length:675 start_codon:yes stop_codon:yes gene_type:complete